MTTEREIGRQLGFRHWMRRRLGALPVRGAGVVTLLFSLTLACASRGPTILSIADIRAASARYDGTAVTVEASLHSSPHGMVLVDRKDPNGVLNLVVIGDIAAVPGGRRLMEMLAEDTMREQSRGVAGTFTGTVYASVEGYALRLSRVSALQWVR